MPEKPIEELWVALMGPAVNVVVAVLLYIYLVATDSLVPLSQISVGSGSFMERLLIANISLVLFNILPAFPMDGGRVLRALLAMRLDYVRATQVAAFIGQGMAFVLGFIGLFGNPFLLFIALFVWIGASQEAGAVQVKNSMGGIPVTRAMLTDFRTLSPRDNLSQVVAYILAGSQHDFPVVDANGRVAGILERYPVSIRWEIKNIAEGSLLFVDDKPVNISKNGSIQIDDPKSLIKLKLSSDITR